MGAEVLIILAVAHLYELRLVLLAGLRAGLAGFNLGPEKPPLKPIKPS